MNTYSNDSNRPATHSVAVITETTLHNDILHALRIHIQIALRIILPRTIHHAAAAANPRLMKAVAERD